MGQLFLLSFYPTSSHRTDAFIIITTTKSCSYTPHVATQSQDHSCLMRGEGFKERLSHQGIHPLREP